MVAHRLQLATKLKRKSAAPQTARPRRFVSICLNNVSRRSSQGGNRLAFLSRTQTLFCRLNGAKRYICYPGVSGVGNRPLVHPNVGLNWNVNTGHVTVGVARFVRNRLVFGQYSQKNAHVNARRAPEVCEDRTPKAAGRNAALQWRDFGLIDPARLGCDGEGRLQGQPQILRLRLLRGHEGSGCDARQGSTRCGMETGPAQAGERQKIPTRAKIGEFGNVG